MLKKKIVLFVLVVLVFSLQILAFASMVGCSSKADVAARNLAIEAEDFKLVRRVMFYNGITGEFFYTMEGLCSIEDQTIQLEVTCKVGEDEKGNSLILKNLQGLSDNVTYTVIQLGPETVDEYRFKVLVRPEALLPDFELDLSGR